MIMAQKLTLKNVEKGFSELGKGKLLRKLHILALDYAARGETHAKATARAKLNIRTGRLVASIAGKTLKRPNGLAIQLSAGGGGKDVKYAGVHEFGATGANAIRPKKGKFLTIPVHRSLKTKAGVGRYASARDVPGLAVAQSRKGQMVLVHARTGEVWYLLRKRVEIPARPYLAPAMKMIEKKMIPEIGRMLLKEMP